MTAIRTPSWLNRFFLQSAHSLFEKEAQAALSVDDAETRVREEFLSVRSTADALARAADAVSTTARGAYTVAERDAARAEHRAEQRISAETSAAFEHTSSVLHSRIQRLAPGVASASFTDPLWRGGEWCGTTSRYIRVGSIALDGKLLSDLHASDASSLPALVPLLDTGNLALISPDTPTSHTAMLAMLRSVVLRSVASAPVGKCSLTVFDPKLRGVLSSFSRLRTPAADLYTEPLSTSEELAEFLTQARSAAAATAEMAGRHHVEDLGALREATGQQLEPYQLLVLLDYPYGIDPRTHTELLRLALAGPKRGVSLVVHHDPHTQHSNTHRIDTDELLKHTNTVKWQRNGVEVSALPGVRVLPDEAPSAQLIESVCTQIGTAAEQGAAPLIEFAQLLEPPELRWTHNATDGLHATVGRSGLDATHIDLRSADPALPNMLVGGASGQGKSNFLLVLLHSLASRYSPEEMEMYLLDFKEGLEFDRLGPDAHRPHWLPHAKVLGLEGDRMFGLAVLRHINDVFRERAEKLRAGGANSLSAYRAQHPDSVIPRTLVVIDEFQVLVAEADEIGREAIAILETLARRGRAVGVHLILASQTLSGIDTLANKERSIFGQFPWRISMKTEASESEAVLGRGNTEASKLRYRGEIVLNSEYGAVQQNRRAVVAYADERSLEKLREELFDTWQEPQKRPPRVFYASRPTPVRTLPEYTQRVLNTAEEASAVLGVPVEVEPHPVNFEFSTDPGRALAIIGDGRHDALGILTSCAYSLAAWARTQRTHAEFLLLDGVSSSSTPLAEVQTLTEMLALHGHTLTRVKAGEIGPALISLSERLDRRLGDPDTQRPEMEGQPPVYVLGAGLHRAPRLNQMTMAGASPAVALQRIVRDGPLARIFTIGWWNALRVFQEHLGYEVAPLVAGAMFLRAPESDVQAVCGPYLRYRAQIHRGLFIDKGRGGQPTGVVPFATPTEVEARSVLGGEG